MTHSYVDLSESIRKVYIDQSRISKIDFQFPDSDFIHTNHLFGDENTLFDEGYMDIYSLEEEEDTIPANFLSNETIKIIINSCYSYCFCCFVRIAGCYCNTIILAFCVWNIVYWHSEKSSK